jgi:hypothetical protein
MVFSTTISSAIPMALGEKIMASHGEAEVRTGESEEPSSIIASCFQISPLLLSNGWNRAELI